ncbi:hypothetical protein WMF04_36495 [Sorangium sp. So ce260]|uniref:hypothetical protein n=1 Tax=Sorangium sp. So ce260 TaxID=3133291 RepID=UPI003F62EAF0
MMNAAFTRAEGLTPSEQNLKRLCDHAFLSLWSYPNVHRSPGKELCDLLVVFEKSVFLFSVKSCAFPTSGSPQQNWERWRRRAIDKSIEQLAGAERSLRAAPDRVFLDANCTTPFPLRIPTEEEVRYFRVAVVHGAADACRQALGGSGGLMLCPDTSPEECPAFAIGDHRSGNHLVHVIDEVGLDVLLKELDTVTDLLSYFRAREEFFEAGRLAWCPTEADLVALYMWNQGADQPFAFPETNAESIVVAEGHWAGLLANPAYRSRQLSNRASYVWDQYIEIFSEHVRARTLVYGNDQTVQQHERSLRVMASESRLNRRLLALAMLDLYGQTGLESEHSGVRVVLPSQRPHVAYVFCLLSPGAKGEDANYRHSRICRLRAYCEVTKYLHPTLTDVVGVATYAHGAQGASEDLFHISDLNWDNIALERARKLHEDYGLLKDTFDKRLRANEFPIPLGQQHDEAVESRKNRNRRKRERRLRARG